MYDTLTNRLLGLFPSYVLEYDNNLRFGDRFNPRFKVYFFQELPCAVVICTVTNPELTSKLENLLIRF
jgi:hypothetical protein